MALFDNSDLLNFLGVNPESATQQQVQDVRDYGESLLKTQLPDRMTSHWQGASYLLDKVLGRVQTNAANRSQQQMWLNALKDMPGYENIGKGNQGFSQGNYQSDNVNSNNSGIPASIRNNNPGAMWPGKTASTFGSTSAENLKDGNKIAQFEDPVDGAAAMFGLLKNKYVGKPLNEAIKMWSGGNSSDQYTKLVASNTGLSPDTVLTPELLNNPAIAVPMAKAMAKQEAGKEFPLTDDQWKVALDKANGNISGGQGQNIASGDTGSPLDLLKGTVSDNPQAAPQAAPQQMADATNQMVPQQMAQQGPPPFADRFPPMPPPMSQQELMHINQLPPNLQQQYLSARTARFTPQTFDTELGTHWALPNGQTGFINKPKYDKMKVGDVEVPTRTIRDPQTGESVTQFQLPGGNGKGNSWGTIEDLQNKQADMEASKKGKVASAEAGAKLGTAPMEGGIEAAQSARKQIPLLDVISAIDEMPATANIHTGKYADQILGFQQTVNDILPGTFDKNAIANAEALKKANVNLASALAKGLTNRPTQYDFKTFISSTPGIENSPMGRKVLSSLYRTMAQQDIDIGKFAIADRNDPDKYQKDVDQYYKDNPISVQKDGKTYRFIAGKPMQVDGEEGGKSQSNGAPQAKKLNFNLSTGKWE